ncbi:MAG TPA: hypothetical protein VGU02_10835 [Gaiellaceae bacterium]|nr:hypothetical protein [Gaiellaceae bacterium]
MDDLPLAFTVQKHDPPAVEVRINFGVATGRAATPAEVDRLAALLLDEVGDVSIICEERHEIGHGHEASVQMVRVELPTELPEENTARIVERCNHWARLCASDRHLDTAEI